MTTDPSAIDMLCALAGAPLCDQPPDPDRLARELGADVAAPLMGLLGRKNGFHVFGAALHVFPDRAGEGGLVWWNSPTCWRDEYGPMAERATFFAEDVFGEQFCLRDGAVHRFDAETGRFSAMAPDIEAWAKEILRDPHQWSGAPLLRRWQEKHGPLPAGKRLVPKIPFVVGGEYAVENLYAGDPVQAMRFRGDFANQIAGLPDGTQIKLRVTR